MKKLVLFLSLISSVFAAQSGSYMGFGAGYGMLKIDGTSTLNDKVTQHRASDGVTGSFALGHKYGEYGRIYALGMYKKASSIYENAGTFSLSYNFLIPVAEDAFSIYLGPVAGYTVYNDNGIDLSGAHYGAEIGVIFNLTNTIELEAGYRILKEKGTYSGINKETAESVNAIAERSQNFSIQLNFYFDSEKYFKYDN